MSAAVKKVRKIWQIVKLKRVMKRWHSLSLGRPEPAGSDRPVRPGFLAVYVGPARRRFVIPARFLNLPVFAALLERAEEEYGALPAGGISLSCDVAFFRWVLDALERDEGRFRGFDLDGFVKLFSDLGLDSSPFNHMPTSSAVTLVQA